MRVALATLTIGEPLKLRIQQGLQGNCDSSFVGRVVSLVCMAIWIATNSVVAFRALLGGSKSTHVSFGIQLDISPLSKLKCKYGPAMDIALLDAESRLLAAAL